MPACSRDPRFAHILMLLKREKGLAIGGNEPYRATDESDYTIPVHGEQRGLHHVAIEVRRDLIATVCVSKRGKRCSRVCCRRRTANLRQPRRAARIAEEPCRERGRCTRRTSISGPAGRGQRCDRAGRENSPRYGAHGVTPAKKVYWAGAIAFPCNIPSSSRTDTGDIVCTVAREFVSDEGNVRLRISQRREPFAEHERSSAVGSCG